jgi:outer membrane protein insertion porin family
MRSPVHAAWLAALLSIGCGRAAPAVAPPPAPAPATTAPEAEARATRSVFVLRDGAPCALTVEITGARRVPASELFTRMQTLEEPYFDRDVLERDLLVLAAHYYDRGYIQVDVGKPAMTAGADGRSMTLRIAVQEGPQYRVRLFEAADRVNGLAVPPMGGWTTRVKPGDVFSRHDLMVELGWLTRIYQDAGYADVTAEPDTDLDPAAGEVTIRVPIVRGYVHSFGRLRFTGLVRTREADVRALLVISEGQRFTETGLERSKRALQDSGLFARVDVSTQKGEKPGQIDVSFELTEQPHAPPVAEDGAMAARP